MKKKKKSGFGKYFLATFCSIFGGVFIGMGPFLLISTLIGGGAFTGKPLYSVSDYFSVVLSCAAFVAIGIGLSKISAKLSMDKTNKYLHPEYNKPQDNDRSE